MMKQCSVASGSAAEALGTTFNSAEEIMRAQAIRLNRLNVSPPPFAKVPFRGKHSSWATISPPKDEEERPRQKVGPGVT